VKVFLEPELALISTAIKSENTAEHIRRRVYSIKIPK
jgi:hypothetical protein